jgi:hypothetical protein
MGCELLVFAARSSVKVKLFDGKQGDLRLLVASLHHLLLAPPGPSGALSGRFMRRL